MVTELNKETFLRKVFNYEENTDWYYEGDLPCIVEFYRDTCGPSLRLAPICEELAQEYANSVLFYKVNCINEPELSGTFGFTAVPYILFVPLEGQPQSHVGFLPKETMELAISQVLDATKGGNDLNTTDQDTNKTLQTTQKPQNVTDSDIEKGIIQVGEKSKSVDIQLEKITETARTFSDSVPGQIEAVIVASIVSKEIIDPMLLLEQLSLSLGFSFSLDISPDIDLRWIQQNPLQITKPKLKSIALKTWSEIGARVDLEMEAHEFFNPATRDGLLLLVRQQKKKGAITSSNLESERREVIRRGKERETLREERYKDFKDEYTKKGVLNEVALERLERRARQAENSKPQKSSDEELRGALIGALRDADYSATKAALEVGAKVDSELIVRWYLEGLYQGSIVAKNTIEMIDLLFDYDVSIDIFLEKFIDSDSIEVLDYILTNHSKFNIDIPLLQKVQELSQNHLRMLQYVNEEGKERVNGTFEYINHTIPSILEKLQKSN